MLYVSSMERLRQLLRLQHFHRGGVKLFTIVKVYVS